MINLWSFLQQLWAPSGLKQSTTQYQWQPTLTAHDPNPPIVLENVVVIPAMTAWHQPEPQPPYSTRPRRDETVAPAMVIPFVPATVLVSSWWQPDPQPGTKKWTIRCELASAPVFVPAPIAATVFPDSYWEADQRPASRARCQSTDAASPVLVPVTTASITSWLQPDARPQRASIARRDESAGPVFVPSTTLITSWLQPESRPQARRFSQFSDTSFVPFVPAAAAIFPDRYTQAELSPRYRNRAVPFESAAAPVLSQPTPAPQFVTVGQVPLLRNHIMAGVSPMRRQRKRSNRTGGF